jgi:ribosomal protein S18 acetylase RimI-like enzyme
MNCNIKIHKLTIKDVKSVAILDKKIFGDNTVCSKKFITGAIRSCDYNYVAKDDKNNIVGYIISTFLPDKNYHGRCLIGSDGKPVIKEIFTVCSLAVIEEMRNKKIATSLLKTFITNATKTINRITLQVRKSNKVAIALYKKHEFIYNRTLPMAYGDEDGIEMIYEIKRPKRKMDSTIENNKRIKLTE